MQKMQAMLLRWSIGASDITPSPCSMRDAKGSSNLRNKEFHAAAGHAEGGTHLIAGSLTHRSDAGMSNRVPYTTCRVWSTLALFRRLNLTLMMGSMQRTEAEPAHGASEASVTRRQSAHLAPITAAR